MDKDLRRLYAIHDRLEASLRDLVKMTGKPDPWHYRSYALAKLWEAHDQIERAVIYAQAKLGQA